MAPATLAKGDTVVITSTLRPVTLEVAPGSAVTWRNDDTERHRIRSREGPERFDSGNLEPGERFTFTFTVEGTYPYLDHRNEDDPAYFGTIVVTSAPGGGTDAGTLATSGSVTIGDRLFVPTTVEVATGGTIKWTNTDSESHTATSADGAFDSGILAPGGTFSHTFDTAGTYPFFCAIHPEMQGTIEVSDAAAASPAPAAASSPQPSPGITSADPSPAAVAAATPGGSPSAGPLVSASPDAGAADSSAVITVIDRAFDPTAVEIPVGGSVEWKNEDTEGHTATAVDVSFDSGVIGPGGTFTHTFDSAGTYDFFCAIHAEMRGTITVVAAGPSPPSG
jgi:plastocyanin